MHNLSTTPSYCLVQDGLPGGWLQRQSKVSGTSACRSLHSDLSCMLYSRRDVTNHE